MSGDAAALAVLLRRKAAHCDARGSALYADLLERAARDVEQRGPCFAILADHAGDPEGSALALRFMSAVHRLVLEGEAPRLARHYPSTGGTPDGPWPAFVALAGERAERLRELVQQPIQTNEVGRAAALLPGFMTVARETGLPLRVLEVGASAGLLLRFDRYRYEADGASWGPARSPVRLGGFDRAPRFGPLTVAARRGCDLDPLDPSDDETRLRLRSTVWADQLQRRALLDAALGLARRFPVEVDRAPACEWLDGRLADEAPGEATVVLQSIVWQYLTEPERERLRALLAAAGNRATPAAPLAWLRLEPNGDHARVTLTTWPQGRERAVADAAYHGPPIRLLPTAPTPR